MLVLGVALAQMPVRAHGSVIRLEHGGQGLIAKALRVAASGDTILLGADVFYEAGLEVAQERLTILGSGSAGSGSIIAPLEAQLAQPMLYNSTGKHIVLSGVTIQGAYLTPPREYGGAAMTWLAPSGSVRIASCVFEENKVDYNVYEEWTGGVRIYVCDDVVISGSHFLDNGGGGYGSNLSTFYCRSVTVEDCKFTSGIVGFGYDSQVYVYDCGDVRITGCSVVGLGDGELECGGGIRMRAGSAVIERNVIGPRLCGDLLLVEGRGAGSVVRVSDNVIWDVSVTGTPNWCVVGPRHGSVEWIGNTVYNVNFGRNSSGTCDISRSVFVGGHMNIGDDTHWECNVLQNEWVYFPGDADVDTSSTIRADPLFCGPAEGNFEVAGSSVCLAKNNGGCGRIGVFGKGCVKTAVDRMTWGALKLELLELMRREGR